MNVTDVREELGELIVEGTLTTDPALRISVHSEDRSHAQRSIGEQLTMTIVLTRWPSGPEPFDAREVCPGRGACLLLDRGIALWTQISRAKHATFLDRNKRTGPRRWDREGSPEFRFLG